MHAEKDQKRTTHRLEGLNFLTCTCILLTAFISFTSAQPENWELRNYSLRDGLPSNMVNCLIKDDAGFLWIGTDQGLCRFDGYTFTSILLPSREKHTLSKIKILGLLKDTEGVLWLGTSEGLFRYDPGQASTKIRQYRYLPGSEGADKITQPVNKLFLDSQGRLWFTCTDLDDFTNFGLRYFDINREKFTYIRIDSTFSADQHQQSTGYATYIIEDSKRTVWTGMIRNRMDSITWTLPGRLDTIIKNRSPGMRDRRDSYPPEMDC